MGAEENSVLDDNGDMSTLLLLTDDAEDAVAIEPGDIVLRGGGSLAEFSNRLLLTGAGASSPLIPSFLTGSLSSVLGLGLVVVGV